MGGLRSVDRRRNSEDASSRDCFQDVANLRLNRLQVVPLTTNVERIFPGEAIVDFGHGARKAMANQIMTAAKERFGKRIGTLDRTQLLKVENAIIVQLGLDSVVRPSKR